MRKVLMLLLFVSLSLSFTSCAVVQSLLGINECAYPDCDRDAIDDCNYCINHCNQGDYYVPAGVLSNAKKGIDKQVQDYNSRNYKPNQ